MVTSFEATAYGLKPFTIPRLVRHRQAASAFARLPPASAYGLQLRYNELKKAKGYQGWTEEEYGDRVLVRSLKKATRVYGLETIPHLSYALIVNTQSTKTQ